MSAEPKQKFFLKIGNQEESEARAPQYNLLLRKTRETRRAYPKEFSEDNPLKAGGSFSGYCPFEEDYVYVTGRVEAVEDTAVEA